MDFPNVVLSNGLKVANFSSPHPFTFVDGTVLPACSFEHADMCKLDAIEIEKEGIKGTVDIELSFRVNAKFLELVGNATKWAQQHDVDIFLAPLPLMTALKSAGMNIGIFRSIRVADRNTKKIHIDRFCI